MGLLSLFKTKPKRPLPPWGKGRECMARRYENGRYPWDRCFQEMRPTFVLYGRDTFLVWKCPLCGATDEERSTPAQAKAWGFELPSNFQGKQEKSP